MDTMIRTFFRHLLESIKSLKRNGWMTVASVSAVTITLTLVGVFMAVIMNATKLAQDIEGNVDVSVFVDIGTKDEEMKKLEKEKIILGYNTMIDWEKYGDDSVSAMIEVNVTPQREFGFDAIAERIYRFDEVKTVYLMSGSFDLLVIIEGKSLKNVADFVARRLSTIEGVTSTRSHFMLKPYKKDGIIIDDKETDHRLVVSP